jgi:hypothetical protein
LEEQLKITQQGSDAKLLTLEEANRSYVDSIQNELGAIDLSTFSSGDLQRLTDIFINELRRVNEAKSKQVGKAEKMLREQ